MKGATRYAKLFKTGQYGKLYITSSSHARGKTFRIQILPEGEIAKPNGSINQCLNSNATEVYGVVAGNPGWSETYGWLHEGNWQVDFENLVKDKESEVAETKRLQAVAQEKKGLIASKRVEDLLSKY